VINTLVFGSGPKCDVVINDPYVSIIHFEAQQDELGIWITAKLTTNKTYIMNNSWTRPYMGVELIPGQRTLLKPGQAVQAGRTIIPYGSV